MLIGLNSSSQAAEPLSIIAAKVIKRFDQPGKVAGFLKDKN